MVSNALALALGTLALGLLAGCGSVAWQEPDVELPQQWRGSRLYVVDSLLVLATSESSAADVAESTIAAARQFSDGTGQPIGTGLLIAVAIDDPLPMGSAQSQVAAAARWSRDFEGPRLSWQQIEARAKQLEIEPGLLVRMFASTVPTDALVDDLGIPAALVARAEWACVVPTSDCIAAAADAIADAAIDKADLSFFERIATAAFLPSAMSQAREEVQRMVNVTLLTIWLGQLPEADRAAAKAALVERLRSADDDASPLQ